MQKKPPFMGFRKKKGNRTDPEPRGRLKKTEKNNTREVNKIDWVVRFVGRNRGLTTTKKGGEMGMAEETRKHYVKIRMCRLYVVSIRRCALWRKKKKRSENVAGGI